MGMRTFWLNLGWLVMLVVTIAVPLGLDAAGRLTYFTSLGLWGIPILYLWPVFNLITAEGTGRRRRALRWTVGFIVALGILLDFVFGHLTLRFPGCSEPAGAGPYVLCLPAVGGHVPLEELLFYAMGPVAIVLVYGCADERWLSRYNPKDDLLDLRLIQLSPRLAIVAVGAAVTALILWRVNGTFPTYWPAFAVTTLYVLVTSLIWEVTLAIPRQWWGYERSGMIGLTITAWSRGDAIFPVEAAVVWLFAPFASILTYEFAKALAHHPRTITGALFGEEVR
jgi:hypothetical protein